MTISHCNRQCERGKKEDKTRQDKTRQDKTRQDKTRQDKTRQDKTRQDKTRQDKTRQGKARQGKTRQDKTRQDKTRQDKTRQDKTRQDKTRQDKTRQDKTRQGLYVAVRCVRSPLRDGIPQRFVRHTNCTADSECPAYKSTHYIIGLVHLFRIATRLIRLIRKLYSYGSDVLHTLRPIRRLLLIRTQRSATQGGGPRVVVSTAAFHARVRGSVPGLGGLKETKMFLPHPRVKVSIVGSLRDREVTWSASDHQGSNFGPCVWRTVSPQSSHHPQEVLLAQFSLYVHKGGLKPDSFHFISFSATQ